MNSKFWKNLKKDLSILTAIVGIAVPIFCFYIIPDINILFDPLSKFGIEKETKLIWMWFIQIIALLLYINNTNHIDKIKHYLNNIQSLVLKSLNIISSLFLSLTGFITMDIRLFHLGFATIFFLTYTGFIFWWGFVNIKYNLKNTIISISSALFIILSSFITTFGYGYGIFELFFISSIIFWNISIRN